MSTWCTACLLCKVRSMRARRQSEAVDLSTTPLLVLGISQIATQILLLGQGLICSLRDACPPPTPPPTSLRSFVRVLADPVGGDVLSALYNQNVGACRQRCVGTARTNTPPELAVSFWCEVIVHASTSSENAFYRVPAQPLPSYVSCGSSLLSGRRCKPNLAVGLSAFLRNYFPA